MVTRVAKSEDLGVGKGGALYFEVLEGKEVCLEGGLVEEDEEEEVVVVVMVMVKVINTTEQIS